jgi:hypothetical protein
MIFSTSSARRRLRSRAGSEGISGNLTAGITVRVTHGSQRRGKLPPTVANREKSVPMILSGMISAPQCEAMTPAESYTFITPPVDVVRPCGKIATTRPFLICRMSCLTASGRAGSTIT